MKRITLSKRLRICALVFMACVLFSLVPHQTQATGTISVSPAELAFELTGANQTVSQTFTVTNTLSSSASIQIILGGLDQSSGSLLPTDKVDDVLRQAITIAPDRFTIEPQTSKTISVSVTDSDTLPPGGHYASLLISQIEDSDNSLVAAINVNMFIVKRGGEEISLKLDSFSLNGTLLSLPSVATMSFSNGGNVRVIPRGTISLRTDDGSVIAQGIINQTSQPILPGNQVVLQNDINNLSRQWLPTRLNVVVSYRADGEDKETTTTFKRWYVPPFFFLAVIAILLVISLALRLIVQTVKRKKIKTTRPHIEPPIKQPEKKAPRKITVKDDTATKIRVRIK